MLAKEMSKEYRYKVRELAKKTTGDPNALDHDAWSVERERDCNVITEALRFNDYGEVIDDRTFIHYDDGRFFQVQGKA